MKPYLDRSGHLISRYVPIVLSCEMNRYGYWVVTWSAEPGVRFSWTSARVGIARSEAIAASAGALGIPTPAKEGRP